MPPDLPSGPKNFSSLLRGNQNFLGTPLKLVKFWAGSAPGGDTWIKMILSSLRVHTLRKLSFVVVVARFLQGEDTGSYIKTSTVISVNIMVVLCTFNFQQATIHYLAFLFTILGGGGGYSYPIVCSQRPSA